MSRVTTDVAIGSYVRPDAPPEQIAQGEGWVHDVAVDDQGDPVFGTVVFRHGRAELGSLPACMVDVQTVTPVNKAQIRNVVRRLHTELGQAKGRPTQFQIDLSDSAHALEQVIR